MKDRWDNERDGGKREGSGRDVGCSAIKLLL